MANAFSPSVADFSNLVDGGGVFVQSVRHKTYVETDEAGTEAAAVTVVGVGVTSMPSYPVMRVDRPFMFVLRERHTGTVLFMGKIARLPGA